MLKKLKLINYRQHKDSILEFIPGINTIVGANNSGKSTIPEAIEFALYGTKALRDSAKGYIRDGQDDGSAVILLDVNGQSMSVGRNSKDAMVTEDGKAKAKYKSAVTQYIGNITGVNHAGFRLGHYVRQKELAAFAGLRPGKRHESIERMLKVNAVDLAIAALKERIDDSEVRLKLLTARYRSPELVDDQLMDLEVVGESLDRTAKELESQLQAVKTELVAEQATVTEVAVTNTKIDELTDRLSSLQECLESSSGLHDYRDRVQTELQKLTRVSDELYNSLQTRYEELQKAQLLYNRAQDIKTELDKLRDLTEPVTVCEPVQPSDSDVRILRNRLTELNTELASYRTLQAEAVCSRCKQPLSQQYLHGLINGIEEQVIKIRETELPAKEAVYQEAKSRYAKDKSVYETYRREKLLWSQAVTRRTELLANLVEVEFDETEKTKVAEAIQAARLQREAWLRLEGELSKIDSKLEERDRLQFEISGVLDKLTECGPRLTYDGPWDQLKDLEEQLQQQIRANISERAHCSGRIEELRKELQTADNNKLALESVSVELAELKVQREGFVLFKRYLTGKIRPKLQEVSETLFHKVTKNRYASYQLSDSYDISLTTHKGYVRKLSTISGSENDLACLCLRLAIATLNSSRLAGNLGFIILDEISGAFDDSRTKETLAGLLELRDVIPQIINITHKPVEMKFADRLITVTESNGLSAVTWRDA